MSGGKVWGKVGGGGREGVVCPGAVGEGWLVGFGRLDWLKTAEVQERMVTGAFIGWG